MFEMFEWGKQLMSTIQEVGDFLFTPNEALIEFVGTLEFIFEGIPLLGDLISDFLHGVSTVPLAYLLTGSFLVVFLVIKLVVFFKNIIL